VSDLTKPRYAAAFNESRNAEFSAMRTFESIAPHLAPLDASKINFDGAEISR
jgi:hypothetical protein